MLKNSISEIDKLPVHGLLVGVELESDTNIDAVMKLIGDTLYNYPGVGTIDVEHLGEIEVLDDTTMVVNDDANMGLIKES